MPSAAREASQRVGVPMIAGIDRHHSREYHQIYKKSWPGHGGSE
jgi:hypothetical protein